MKQQEEIQKLFDDLRIEKEGCFFFLGQLNNALFEKAKEWMDGHQERYFFVFETENNFKSGTCVREGNQSLSHPRMQTFEIKTF